MNLPAIHFLSDKDKSDKLRVLLGIICRKNAIETETDPFLLKTCCILILLGFIRSVLTSFSDF